MEAEGTIRLFCGSCGGRKNHVVIAKREVKSHDDNPYHWGEDHYFCQCAGCDAYCYAIAEWTEDDFDNYTGEMEYEWKTYPFSKNARKPVDDYDEFPQRIKLIYQETIGALNAQLPLLTAIGLRTIIEAICVDQGVSGKNLEKKLAVLQHLAFFRQPKPVSFTVTGSSETSQRMRSSRQTRGSLLPRLISRKLCSEPYTSCQASRPASKPDESPNMSLQPTVIPLRGLSAGELVR